MINFYVILNYIFVLSLPILSLFYISNKKGFCWNFGLVLGRIAARAGVMAAHAGKWWNFGCWTLLEKHVRGITATRAWPFAARAGLTATRAAQAGKNDELHFTCSTLRYFWNQHLMLSNISKIHLKRNESRNDSTKKQELIGELCMCAGYTPGRTNAPPQHCE